MALELGEPISDEFMVSAAIRQVARSAVGRALALNPPDWEDYPEIGEHDWERVEAEVDRITERFEGQGEKFKTAYRLLAERAGEAT